MHTTEKENRKRSVDVCNGWMWAESAGKLLYVQE